MYDYLIVGAGLYGSTCAYELKKRGYKVLVIEKRDHIGGNIYTKNIDNINVHVYGPHIFHTNKKEIWDYVNQFAKFNHYINAPLAIYKSEVYNLPFNMNTFSRLWPDVITPEDAKRHISEEVNKCNIKKPLNLEETAISLVGTTIYEKLIKGYTAKQWGRECKDLPSFIIQRIPVRFVYNNNYFDDYYQGIPIGGYTQIIGKMLEGIEVRLSTNFLSDRDKYESIAKKIIYTGPIDEYYNYLYGKLDFRSLRFEMKRLDVQNFQGCGVVNYTEQSIPYTRIIEHKHFEPENHTSNTIISYEYPLDTNKTNEPYYPINNDRNNYLYAQYLELASSEVKVFFGGRLGNYKYFDMDDTIREALDFIAKIK